jgi:hypothetical protein
VCQEGFWLRLHKGLETGKMLRAVVENGKGRWEYFGPLFEFREEKPE